MNEQLIQTQPSPADFIVQAIQSGADIDKLERLMAMKERWDKEQARKAFLDAMTDFQTECPDLRKTKRVHFETSKGSTEYHYAPLADIDRQIKGLMKKHGLSKRWEIKDNGEKIKVICLVSHRDGHTETTEMEASADMSGSKNAIQGKGSAIEYMKRYTLIGALGLTTADTDIDARMPELDIDKLHQQYMDLYNQIILKDRTFITPGNPDNWAAERTPDLYVKAIGKARQLLTQLSK